jgi:tripartite-type tricarboxylate transporter receptor subunit TctC
VPTMQEAGLQGYTFQGWVGICAPAATPAPVLAKAYAAIAQVLGTQEARDWFAAGGAETGLQPPEAFAAFMREEHAKWGRVIRAAGIRAE